MDIVLLDSGFDKNMSFDVDMGFYMDMGFGMDAGSDMDMGYNNADYSWEVQVRNNSHLDSIRFPDRSFPKIT